MLLDGIEESIAHFATYSNRHVNLSKKLCLKNFVIMMDGLMLIGRIAGDEETREQAQILLQSFSAWNGLFEQFSEVLVDVSNELASVFENIKRFAESNIQA